MTYYSEKQQKTVQLVSVAVGSLLLILIFISSGYIPQSPYWIPLERRVNIGLALGFLLMMAAPAFIEMTNNRFLSAVEDNLPLFLRDITNEVQSGVPLMFAMETASTKDYGPITPPLRQTMNRINVTSDIESSLIWLGEKLVVPQARRLTYVLIEAYNTGGRISDILESSLKIYTVFSKQKSDREGLTSPYLFIVYLGTAVFLVISWVLLTKFLIPLSLISQDPNIQASGLVSPIFNIDYYWSILFWAAVIEAVSGGLLGGKIKHGKLVKGLQYASILLLITIFFFNSWLFR